MILLCGFSLISFTTTRDEMQLKLVLITCLTVTSLVASAQQEDYIELHLRHNEYSAPLYVLDGLQLSQTSFSQLHLNKKNIKKVYILNSRESVSKYGKTGNNGAIEIHSKMVIVLNGLPLRTQREKEKLLSNTDPDKIVSIVKNSHRDGIKKYNGKDKYGVIEITTDNNP
jgi:hypothetical protein